MRAHAAERAIHQSFWALAVRKADRLRFEDMFRHHAVAMLTSDGFDQAEIERLLPAIGHRFAKTNSRPVAGSNIFRPVRSDEPWAANADSGRLGTNSSLSSAENTI